ILGDLFLWRGDFSVGDADLVPVLNEREQSHMRDVRGVFAGFELLVLMSIVVLALAFRRRQDAASRAPIWRAVGSGARGLVIAGGVAGAFALFAFDAAFEVFHQLFFSAGSYTFDPRTDLLVQLFPEQFWSETAIAVGVVAIVVAILTAWQSSRRAGVSSSTPFDPTSPNPGDDAAIALSGPLTSIGIAGLLFGGSVALVSVTREFNVAAAVLSVLVLLNLLLGLINLVPAYPLDGGRIVRDLAWRRSGSGRTGWRTGSVTGRLTGFVVMAI